MVFLDSTIIIDYLNNNEQAVQTIQSLIFDGKKLKTTLFNYFEIYFGEIAFSKSAKKTEIALAFLESVEIISPTIQSMKKSAEIKLELKKNGRTIEPNDIFIAGIAVSDDETLYTKNTKDFSHIKGLKTKTY